ncbi:MAG: hypothetical protein Q9213_003757 [Squamulea squamosa]
MSAIGNSSEREETEAPLYEWLANDRHYTITPTQFIKRQQRPHERITNMWGELGTHVFNIERLENERNALHFIAENSTIPVPRVLDWSMDEHGIASLTMEALNGRVLGDITDDLSELRLKYMGQLGGVFFPPPRMHSFEPRERRAGPAIQSATEQFIYYHNDLGVHNVVIEPDSLEVKCLIDWEYSGFFPPGFEFPFWRYTFNMETRQWENEDGVADFTSRRKLLEDSTEVVETPSLAMQPPLQTFWNLFSWIRARGSRMLSVIFGLFTLRRR